jgi:tricorn protease
MTRFSIVALFLATTSQLAVGQETRLLRQPTGSATQVAFTYGADLWVADRAGGQARRLTSTPAVESDPHFSPDGRQIAFSSNRSGSFAVYLVGVEGGDPTRLTWHPSGAFVRGWTPDGRRVLYASGRETAPADHDRLWTVAATGGPSTVLPAPWAHRGSYSGDGRRIVVDRVARWDGEWRGYRGGQNTALVMLDLASLDEVRLPNERTTDTHPVWLGGRIFFISDRDWASNVWSYDVGTRQVAQVTRFTDAEVKHLSGGAGGLVFEQDGWVHTLDPASGQAKRLSITATGDFPWAATRWEDVSRSVRAASLSATGQRVLLEARGEIFTVPVEKGGMRNLTRSSNVADRAPVWSPDGKQVAWFSDSDAGYRLVIGSQDGLGATRALSIGESKMAWEPTWSPDGSRIAFVDDDVRVRVIELTTGKIVTADVGGTNLERGNMGITWSPDSKWLAYAKTFPNNFHRIVAWSAATGTATPLTDPMADAVAPAWDRGGRHLYFLASTNLALGSGWANTSSIGADPTYGAYVMVLRGDDPTPFPLKSDEEAVPPAPKPDTGAVQVRLDPADVDRRIIALPMPVRRYRSVDAGPAGSVFIGEQIENQPGLTINKFVLADAKTDVFVRGATMVAISGDGKKLLYRAGPTWSVVGTDRPPEPGKGTIQVALSMELDRRAEWRQMFDEAWRYERDYFYDPGMHGNDWNAVRNRYRPLVEHVRHRSDLSYVLDQVNGELSVGHSFVFGGDMPAVDTSRVGLLGADLVAEGGRWKIARIYTFESWNPGLDAPLDRPGTKAKVGHFLLAVNGVEMAATDDPYRLLDGTAGRQTLLHLNDRPTMDGAWTVTVEPIRNESELRRRAWVEDNRRKVAQLSGGKLAYVWVPNTGGGGTSSFNRYLFAQQDKAGAVIDERFNGGGNLDDYMVDYLARGLRGAATNEVPNGAPILLPQGVLGPKVLLINEQAGSGGDYFPWAFRQQKVGPLIGTRTWGGLVKSSVHYGLVDGGGLTAPDNAIFDPATNKWIAENEGVPPDIEVLLDAKSFAAGRDPQLERGVEEALRLVNARGARSVTPPPFPRPSKRPNRP